MSGRPNRSRFFMFEMDAFAGFEGYSYKHLWLACYELTQSLDYYEFKFYEFKLMQMIILSCDRLLDYCTRMH